MNAARLLSIAGMCLFVTALLGCQQPKMEDMLKAPERPAELDQLNMFVGKWVGAGELTMPGSDEVVTAKGQSTASWAAGGWVLIEEAEETVGDEGITKGVAMWTWDPKAKKFRTAWLNDHGEISHGTATYDAATRTWHMRGEGHNPYTGVCSIGEGTARFVDDHTLEWSYTAWGPWKLKKLAEMKGTSRRQ